MRATVRLWEMAVPGGAVLGAHAGLLGLDGALFLAGGEGPSCRLAGLRAAVLGTALAGAFAWGLLQTPGLRAWRDACTAALLFALYAALAFPAVFSCLGVRSPILFQVAFFAFVAILALVLLLTAIARCFYGAALRKAVANMDRSSSALSPRMELSELGDE